MKAFWSVFAVIDGFFTYIVVVTLLTFAATHLFHARIDAPTVPYLIVNVIYSVLAALLGGWIAGRVAHHRTGLSPLHHGEAVTALLFLINVVNIPKAVGGADVWYPIALTVLTPIACVYGASRVPELPPRRA